MEIIDDSTIIIHKNNISFIDLISKLSIQSGMKLATYQLLPGSIMVLIFITMMGCKTTEKDVKFKIKNKFNGFSEESFESKEKIDTGRTFELFFRLNKKEKCLKFEIHSQGSSQNIAKSVKILKTYFIIEKRVNISKFSDVSSGSEVYSELGRNFDHRWNRKRKLLLCSKKDDPLLKFNKAIYRIRFTTFSNEYYKFFITIHSDNKILFMK